MQLGLEFPSRSLGLTHVVLAAMLATMALLRPRPIIHRLILELATTAILLLPVLWVGPLWAEAPSLKPALGFYVTFVLSLAIPFALAAGGELLLAQRSPAPRPLLRATLPVGVYLLGLIVSYPVSFNYALLYPLIR